MSSAGSVSYDKARKSWGFVIDLPNPDGQRKQVKRRGFTNKKAAQAALIEILGDRQEGTYVEPNRMSVHDFLVDVWLPARRATLRPSTAASYEGILRNYLIPKLGAKRLQALTGADLNRLYDGLLKSGRTESRRHGMGPGLAPKSVRNVHGVLTRAMRDAVRWGHLQRSPCDAADPPKGRSPEMKVWNAEQLRLFVTTANDTRWSAVWRLMATTGMRRGEALGLRWSDIDLDAATVTIQATRIRYNRITEGSTPKTAKGNRTISLGKRTVAALREWRTVQAEEHRRLGLKRIVGGLVVTTADGQAPHPESFSIAFGKVARTAKLPRIRLHDLRHSYATSALAAGVPVKVLSQRLGHADVGVTLSIYAHVLPGDDEDAARRADEILDGEPDDDDGR